MKKLALCFRPVGIETKEKTDRRRADRYDDEVSKKGIVGLKEHKNRKMAAAAGSPKFCCRPRPKKSSRKSFSHVIKSVLFKISLSSKAVKKRLSINIPYSSSSSSKRTTPSASFTAASSFSVTPKSDFATSRSNSLEKKPKTANIRGNPILYVIILVLFATIVFGRCLAILFASSCLFIVPMFMTADYRRLPRNAVKLPLPWMETSWMKQKEKN